MPQKSNKRNLALPDVSRYFLILSILGVTILMFLVIWPFFSVLVYAALITVIFSPVHKFFLNLFKGHRTFSAIISTIIVIILILIPLTLFFVLIAQQAVDAYRFVQDINVTKYIAQFDLEKLSRFPTLYDYFNNFAFEQKFELVQGLLKNVSSYLVLQSTVFLKGVGSNFIKVLVLILCIYFFFRDGDKLKEHIKRLSPLPHDYENEIENKLKNTTYAIVVGGFGSALAQGFVGAIGFAVVGVNQVLFFGTLMAFGALIPYIGPAIIWFPVCIGLLIAGNFTGALILFLWGALLISTVDNIVKPFLIGNRSNMYPLATFLVVLGGLFSMGLKGLVFGPLILSITLSIYHIYKLEYKDTLKA